MGTTITINVSALIFWYKNQHLAPWNEHSDSIADLWSASENGFESSKHSCPICYPQQRHVTNHSICPSSTRPRCQHFINIIGGSSCCHQQQCSLHETKTVCFRTCPLRVNSSCDHSLWGRLPFIDTPPFAFAWHLVPCFLPASQINNCRTNNHEHKLSEVDSKNMFDPWKV